MKFGADDLGLLFICHLIWFRGIWALFPQITLMLKYPYDMCNSTLRWLSHKSKTPFDVKWGAEVFRLLSVCPYSWFEVFVYSFSKLSQYPSTWETGETQPSEGLDTRVTFNWREKRSWRLWITFHVSLHVIWVIWAQFPQIALMPKYL